VPPAFLLRQCTFSALAGGGLGWGWSIHGGSNKRFFVVTLLRMTVQKGCTENKPRNKDVTGPLFVIIIFTLCAAHRGAATCRPCTFVPGAFCFAVGRSIRITAGLCPRCGTGHWPAGCTYGASAGGGAERAKRACEAEAQQRAPLGMRKGGYIAADYSELWSRALGGTNAAADTAGTNEYVTAYICLRRARGGSPPPGPPAMKLRLCLSLLIICEMYTKNKPRNKDVTGSLF